MYEILRADRLCIHSPAENHIHNLSFSIFKGEVLGVLGLGGAGRSSLARMLAGLERIYSGAMWVDGKRTVFNSIREGQRSGIYLIQYESKLIPGQNIAENFTILHKQHRKLVLNHQNVLLQLNEISLEYGIQAEPERRVEDLSLYQKHMLELAVAAYSGAKIIVLNQVDASYSENEYLDYENKIRMMQRKGISFFMIHTDIIRAQSLSDRIMVMRKGEKAGIFYSDQVKPKYLHKILTGVEKFEQEHKESFIQPEVVLEAMHLKVPEIAEDITFRINKGEVIGFIDEKYSTYEKILLLIKGEYGLAGGKLYLNNTEVAPFRRLEIARRGIRYIDRDSSLDNVFLDLTVEENLQLEMYKVYKNKGIGINKRLCQYAMKRKTGLFLSRRKLKTEVSKLDRNERTMIALNRWKLADTALLLLNSPAMSADVVLRKHIWNYVTQMRQEGIPIIYSSSNTEEMFAVCDCVYMVKEGVIIKCLRGMPSERYE
ncbi:ATP-binding cassette domain-containing protein [Ruminococcus sp. OA3]|uniref:ATP-binding cassette domain-containing protein n=1 Tax=Ruminococcus sp. OA3 TaxID=2914164 RepID=UPI001F064B78|nr:ATP-binding cassette domain-containing protein [Ruminococcus sp. OA3]MCH1981717.1 ATP-binding cassette domain-containing protein [Ruminococcus sp. OA3]